MLILLSSIFLFLRLTVMMYIIINRYNYLIIFEKNNKYAISYMFLFSLILIFTCLFEIINVKN